MMNTVSFHYAVAIAGACVIAVYILFGDSLQGSSLPKRKRRRKGIVPGLANIGNSCFLNCILQALASCPCFREWLEHQDLQMYDTPLVASLRKKMIVLCSEVNDCDLDAFDILRALRNHGWVISSEEQDAHELFHALTSTIDDELAMIRQNSNSLLNVSWLVDQTQYTKLPSVEKDSLIPTQLDAPSSTFEPKTNDISLSEDPIISAEENPDSSKIDVGFYRSSSIISKVPFSLKEHLAAAATRKGSLLTDSPFKGHLASQLQCTVCGLKNAEQWSSFESISLTLPGIDSLKTCNYTLHELLNSFILPECVSDVTCDSCTKVKGDKCKTTFTKQMTVGKLPDCLCIHIQRTVWLGNGYAFKRRDHILIPEILNMEPYTYSVSHQPQCVKAQLLGGCQKESPNEEDSSGAAKTKEDPITIPLIRSLSTFCSNNAAQTSNNTFPYLEKRKSSSLYKLQAVVVHVGDVLTGHFITYRRGSKETCSSDRWFYTSDLVVREVSLEEVLDSNAYMILYERNLL